MAMTRYCQKCHADLRGEPIPEHLRDECYGGATHYMRTVGVEIPGVYDGVAYWQCPDCDETWPRK